MPRKNIDLEKVLAPLNIPCPKCGHHACRNQMDNLGSDSMPKCGVIFDPQRKR